MFGLVGLSVLPGFFVDGASFLPILSLCAGLAHELSAAKLRLRQFWAMERAKNHRSSHSGPIS